MIIQIQCDKCELIGSGEEIYTDYSGYDLCEKCRTAQELLELTAQYAAAEKKFESAQDVMRKLKVQIEKLEKL